MSFLTYKHYLKRTICAVSAVCLLAGCAEEADSSRSYIMAAPPQDAAAAEAAAPPAEDYTVELSVVSQNLSAGYASNEAGSYSILSFADGSADVQYIDYAQLNATRLTISGVPDSPTYGSLTNMWGGSLPLWAGEHLYIITQRGAPAQLDSHGAAAAGSITQLSPTGEVLQQVSFPVEFSFQLSSAVLFDGENLYFIMAEQQQEIVYHLMQFNAASGEYHTLHTLEAGYEYTLYGHWDMGPVVIAADALPPLDDPAFNSAWENRGFALHAMGLASGSMSPLLLWQQDTIYHTMQGNMFYFWSEDTLALHSINADTKDIQQLAADFAPNDYTVAQVQEPMLNNLVRLRFSLHEGRTAYHFAVSPQDGAVLENNATQLGDTVTVCAESAEHFLVISGERFVGRELTEPGYVPSEDDDYNSQFSSVPVYSLITKQDYWAGNANFIDIEDLVYE